MIPQLERPLRWSPLCLSLSSTCLRGALVSGLRCFRGTGDVCGYQSTGHSRDPYSLAALGWDEQGDDALKLDDALEEGAVQMEELAAGVDLAIEHAEFREERGIIYAPRMRDLKPAPATYKFSLRLPGATAIVLSSKEVRPTLVCRMRGYERKCVLLTMDCCAQPMHPQDGIVLYRGSNGIFQCEAGFPATDGAVHVWAQLANQEDKTDTMFTSMSMSMGGSTLGADLVNPIFGSTMDRVASVEMFLSAAADALEQNGLLR